MSKSEKIKRAVIIVGEMDGDEVMRIIDPYYRDCGVSVHYEGGVNEIVAAYLESVEIITLVKGYVVWVNP